jgi:hypothetical protein
MQGPEVDVPEPVTVCCTDTGKFVGVEVTERDKEDARRARDLLLEEQRMSGSVEE